LLGVSRRGQPIAWLILKGETIVSAQRVLSVREHGKLATCLRRAYSAEVASATKAGSRSGRLRAKAGFSGEREGRERRWRIFSTVPQKFLEMLVTQEKESSRMGCIDLEDSSSIDHFFKECRIRESAIL